MHAEQEMQYTPGQFLRYQFLQLLILITIVVYQPAASQQKPVTQSGPAVLQRKGTMKNTKITQVNQAFQRFCMFTLKNFKLQHMQDDKTALLRQTQFYEPKVVKILELNESSLKRSLMSKASQRPFDTLKIEDLHNLVLAANIPFELAKIREIYMQAKSTVLDDGN